MNNMQWMKQVLDKFDTQWACAFTPWGEKIICHITVNGVTRSHSHTSEDGAFERAFLMHIDDDLCLTSRPVDTHIARYLKSTYGHTLPKDADFYLKMPTENDNRFWIDVISEEYAKKGRDDETGSEDPLFEQFVLVPLGMVPGWNANHIASTDDDDSGITF